MSIKEKVKSRTGLLKIGIRDLAVMGYSSRVFEVKIPANMSNDKVLSEVVRRIQVKEE